MNTENELNNLKSEIKQLKFQIKLLINDSPTNHFLLENSVNEEEYDKIINILEKYRSLIDNRKEVNKCLFEDEILSIFNNKKGYHFCITLSKLLSEERRYEEIFATFYNDGIRE